VADTKYGHLVTPLDYRTGTGGANAREIVFVQGEQMAGFDLNFMLGVYNQTGDWAPGRGAHLHGFDELLFFFGYDPYDMNYLGGDLKLAFGKELEYQHFSVPTVGIAAKTVPHCPLITEKVYKPFGHFHLALSAKYSGGPVTQEGTTDGTKYAHLFKKMEAKLGPGRADAYQTVSMSGDDLEGMGMNFMMSLHNQPGPWESEKEPHAHPYDEAMIFFGHDVDNLKYLGAEITIEIGAEREKHTFDVPTVIALPKGTPHMPIVCNRLNKAYRVVQVGLARKFERLPLA
jgi:hypothetical protein